jgi:hypothetical protein
LPKAVQKNKTNNNVSNQPNCFNNLALSIGIHFRNFRRVK